MSSKQEVPLAEVINDMWRKGNGLTMSEEVKLRSRIADLESAVNSVLDQQADNVCWMDVYKTLGALVGREFNPTLLPRPVFDGNCKRYQDFVYDGLPYDVDTLTRVVEEHHQVKQLLRSAGFGVTGTSLLETVKEALADLEDLKTTF